MTGYWEKMEKPVIIAGPCGVESEEQITEIAKEVKKAGATMLRGGAFKPRTKPDSWQGLGEEGLKALVNARDETGLPIVTELINEKHIPLFEKHKIDVIQIGARNCQNFELLKAAGRTKIPVLLKRGMGQRIDEVISGSEYITQGGNTNVALCERGIRTFETATRFTLDLNSVPLMKQKSGLPVIVDPSHGTGVSSIVADLSRAGIAAGADGLIIEAHTKPTESKVDKDQAISPEELANIVKDIRAIRSVLNRNE